MIFEELSKTTKDMQDLQRKISIQKNQDEQNSTDNKFRMILVQLDKTIDAIEYLELIKALRDQILACVAVTMSSADEKQAYRIFEILNGKGKKLQFIDLIKNKIFEILQQIEPVDFAEDKWKELGLSLNR